MSAEEWRPIPGFELSYEASTQGRIRGISRTRLCSNGRTFRVPGKVIKPWRLPTGYLCVVIGHSGKTWKTRVHRIIATTFIGQIPEGLEVNHIDGDKENNSPDNLEICSRSHNLLHSRRILGHDSGDNHHARVLNSRMAKDIFSRYRSGERPCDLAREYGVRYMLVYNVCRGWGWTASTGAENPVSSV